MSNYNPASAENLVAANKEKQRRSMERYPEDVYGPLGSKERRFKTNKCSRLVQQFGLTYKAYLNMSEAQGHKCAICGEEETGSHNRGKYEVPLTLSVDHDHETGAVRALLCGKCNKGLGLFRDDIETIKKALAYLTEHSGG